MSRLLRPMREPTIQHLWAMGLVRTATKRSVRPGKHLDGELRVSLSRGRLTRWTRSGFSDGELLCSSLAPMLAAASRARRIPLGRLCVFRARLSQSFRVISKTCQFESRTPHSHYAYAHGWIPDYSVISATPLVAPVMCFCVASALKSAGWQRPWVAGALAPSPRTSPGVNHT